MPQISKLSVAKSRFAGEDVFFRYPPEDFGGCGTASNAVGVVILLRQIKIGNPVWHIRHQISSSRVFEFLLSHGIKHIIALQYAHKPGIERQLNNYMSEKCREFNGRITGMATVFPGKNAADFFSLNDILNELK